jgi:Fe2+ or Zn2+ uptake regulation protein
MSQRNLKQKLVALLQENHLLSAGGILAALAQQGDSYNKTSIYRALEQLLDQDQICRHYFDQVEALYELRDHHHSHLVCRHCGKVEMAECLYQQPSRAGDFQVEHHHLTLVGLCKNCQK